MTWAPPGAYMPIRLNRLNRLNPNKLGSSWERGGEWGPVDGFKEALGGGLLGASGGLVKRLRDGGV
jgi:hypothetical protein